MKEILMLILGASIALISAWVKSRIDREAQCSNEIFKQRVSCMNRIWTSFYDVKEVYASKITLGYTRWAAQKQDTALEKLNTFRRAIDESQIVLSKEIISGFRALEN